MSMVSDLHASMAFVSLDVTVNRVHLARLTNSPVGETRTPKSPGVNDHVSRPRPPTVGQSVPVRTPD